MSVTILALLFLAFVLILTYFGYRFIIRRDPVSPDQRLERCSVCRSMFPPAQLLERQSGDTRVYRFCPSCIKSLHEDLQKKTEEKQLRGTERPG